MPREPSVTAAGAAGQFREAPATDGAGGTLWWLLDGFAGMNQYSYFKAPRWVDQRLPPGHTSQADQVGRPGWWLQYPTLRFIFYSPNLLWLLIAIASYLLYPPNFSEAAQLTSGFVLQRVALHLGIMNLFFGFWHCTMYTLRWGKRKFGVRANGPTLARMVHNLWYANLGALQTAMWDALYMYMFASGKLPHVSDAEVASDASAALKTVLWVIWVPMWRDLHFYLAHRFIHISFVYRYVHSLHHRNTDIEPFAGLCMHPIEHLYYLGCAGPAAYMHASPFVVYWNLVHLLISPAASHSGWEDNMQSDQYHFLHHSKFECNYGTSGTPLDKTFGTFREKFGESKTYAGQFKEGEAEDVVEAPAQTYLTGGLRISDGLWARTDQAVYDLLCCVVLPYVLYSAIWNLHGVGGWAVTLPVVGQLTSPRIVAALVAVGPIAVAFLVGKAAGMRQPWRWPFHKDPIASNFGLHLVVQTLFVVLPVYHSVTTLLANDDNPPIYCSVVGCD
eukprot:TRINITY_DN17181_c0_g1_i1.p1 TRINITY_DN17181_c0_g1~~TRINITY_DN17181_c0_g1_i1.p1  ORF type:complete len:503 (+),score=132.94 TRINITY_DN17181_c0_g1_i1:60-1568(+)